MQIEFSKIAGISLIFLVVYVEQECESKCRRVVLEEQELRLMVMAEVVEMVVDDHPADLTGSYGVDK